MLASALTFQNYLRKSVLHQPFLDSREGQCGTSFNKAIKEGWCCEVLLR